MKKILATLLLFTVATLLIVNSLTKHAPGPEPIAELKARYSKQPKASVEHSKFSILQKKFIRPQQVTEACISCHTERDKEVMRSSHWNWEREEYIEGRGIRYVGKKNILNNFCIGIAGSEQSCDKCHIGYGWSDSSFDFSNPDNVDCLACHDNTNTYIKASGGAGMPDSSVNLSFVAQHVGKPLRTNCGTCHFFGGGGNNVKHGDLDMALFDTNRDVDVHMASDGENMQCVNCHTADKHQMLGKLYSLSSMNRNRSTCEQCHTEAPHQKEILNEHTVKVACQTCHIPTYAKVNSTNLTWDWSTAGKLKNGEPYENDDSLGNHSYLSIKGSFTWGRNLTPDYVWFNGTANHYLIGDTISTDIPIKLNSLNGDYNDPDAKIIPVKIHLANQIYDVKNRYLIQPRLFSETKEGGGYWKVFDWNRSAEEGMRFVKLPYSGRYGFIETEMYWPINHMVAPKEKAVQCSECHTRENGRLAKLNDFYMPGRNYNAGVETFGISAIILALIGVGMHASARIIVSKKNRKGINTQ